ncbi:hypothetical protein ILUMI_21924 [Ignelater luminosus]|uniref:Uncharacterized protein n=1 Tax=Ignelater luminosus TaxID=2038154 RepID=A0A8K0G0Z2_IGNLU|nr:hypothetical protein ILUMI_21924 [Ignelater luminosus]
MNVSHIFLVFFTLTNLEISFCFNFDLDFVDIIESDVSNSYFGFSVLLQKGLTSSRVLVGAPKANSTYPSHAAIRQPGALYTCDTEKPYSCRQYVIDEEGNTEHKDGLDHRYYYKNRKDYGLLGASLDGGENEGDPFVVCSPRWINERRDRNGQHYLANGLCYMIQNSRDVNQNGEKFIPLLHAGKQGYTLDEIKYYYAIGETGMSVQYLNEERQLLLGAPGVLSWKGTVAKYQLDVRPGSFGRMIVPNPVYMTSIKDENSYFGYALSYGTFDLRYPMVWYVAGAPRAEELTGLVIIFEYGQDEDSDLNVHKQFLGEQMGSYFGSALLSVDMTGNEASDLLVGAPTYFIEKWDEGCVYYYKNIGEANFEDPLKIYGSKQTGARFGSAISSLGDINHDSYQDVAISAPYEDGQGVIYIYLGNKNGLSTEYSQRIAAKTIDNSLQGFGFTISKAIDIDKNLHNDIAVSAYKSGQVAIIKTRPVIKYSVRLTSSMRELAVNTSAFNVTYCINYASTTKEVKSVDTYIHIIKDYRAVNNNNVSHTVTLEQGNEFCGDIPFMLRGGNSDYSKPFTVEMDYGVLENRQSRFCPTCPVTDPAETRSIVLNVPFANGCGEDNICQPDLKLSVNVEGNLTSLVIGSKTTLKLNVRIENKNEPAYLCQVRTKLPTDIEIVRISSKCDLSEDRVYRCLVDNVLQPDTFKELVFDLDIKKLSLNDRYISLNVTVDSKGEEINSDDNMFLVMLPLRVENNVELSGISFPDQLTYVDEEDNIKSETVDFQHIFTTKNLGPSPLLDINADFYIPVEINVGGAERVAFNVYEPEVNMNNQPIQCTTDYHLGFFNGNTDKTTANTNTTQSTEILNRLRRSTDSENPFKNIQRAEKLYNLPINRTLFINCTNSAIKCMKISCANKDIVHRNQYLQAKIKIRAQIDVLQQIVHNKDIIFLSSSAEVKANYKTLYTFADTLLNGSLIKQEVSYWIYIVCIVAGLLILAIIIFILYKLNFFNRPIHEKLKDESCNSSVKKELDDDDHDHDDENEGSEDSNTK